MRHALFDIIHASPSHMAVERGGAMGNEVSRQALVDSIGWHLSRLFNARGGLLPHLPEYGISDIHEIYRFLPYTQDHLANELGGMARRYEPRLHNVAVRVAGPGGNCIVRATLTARLQDGTPAEFRVRFLGSGEAKVEPGIAGRTAHA